MNQKEMALQVVSRLPKEFVDVLAENECDNFEENWKMTVRVLHDMKMKYISMREELEKCHSEIADKEKTIEKQHCEILGLSRELDPYGNY